MRHSAAGPATANKNVQDPGKAAPAGFVKGPDGKWVKASGSSNPDDASSRAAVVQPKAGNVHHFAPADSGAKSTTAAPKAAPAHSTGASSPAVSRAGASPTTRPTGTEWEKAGQKDGLEIWRIEKLKPVPVDPAHFGKFYAGDSYIVLHTFTKDNRRKWDVHFWLGTHTSQDEAGVAAYKTVELDDALGGAPVQHREVQEHESNLFLSYFKAGVQYLEGGIESGFRHVEKDVYTKRLLHLKGKRNVRVKDVPVSHKSLNKGDVFVLDAGLILYQFNGPEASRMEKAKGLEVTANINSNERGARAKIHILEFPLDNSKPEMKEFWKELGGEGPVAEAAAAGDDAEHEKAAAASVQLFRVSDNSGQLEVTPVGSGSLKKEQLDTSDCFIVDVGSEVFVWVGKGSTQQEKTSAMQFATGYLESSGKPQWTPITRVVEGGETSVFKAHFANWSDVTTPQLGRRTLEKKSTPSQAKIDVGAMHTSSRSLDVGSATKAPVTHKGNGELKVWRVEDFKRAEIPKENYGLFYAGDSYVILYSEKRPGGDDLHYIYFWQGRTSSTDEKGASALLAKELDDSLNGKATQIRVVQSKEPDHFLGLFKGEFIIKQGGHPSGFNSLAQETTPSADKPVHLYHIKGTSAHTSRTTEVDPVTASLNSGDAFVLIQEDSTTIWYGKGCSLDERATAKHTAERLTGGRTKIVEVDEGKESDEFWSVLGGHGEYANASFLYETPKEPRLFWGSNATGVFKVEEIFDFTQDDLAEDDVYILDTYNEVYVWVGSGSNDVEKKLAMETAIDYVAQAPDGRNADTPIYRVNAGSEPPMFTCHFHAWDNSGTDVYTRKMRELKLTEGGASTPTSVRSELASMQAKDVYTYAELQTKPKGVDTANLEKYLSDAEFQTVFGQTKAQFDALPAWKKESVKKQKKLF